MRPGPSRNADPAGLAVTVARVRAGVPAVGEAGAASNPPGDPPWAPGFFLGNYTQPDRKSTRLNPSHSQISYAAFCLQKNSSSDCMSEINQRLLTRQGPGWSQIETQSMAMIYVSAAPDRRRFVQRGAYDHVVEAVSIH